MNCTVAASWPFVIFLSSQPLGEELSLFLLSPRASKLNTASLGRGIKEYGVFTIRNSFRAESDLKSEALRSVNDTDGDVSRNDTMYFFYTHYFFFFVFFLFGQCLLNALIPPWIRQWLTENLYNKVGGKIHDRHIYGCFFLYGIMLIMKHMNGYCW